MISISVWKLELEMPTPRSCRGPAIQCGQPPLRPGTYWEGRVAAPALSRKTVVTTPSRPSAPSARTARAPPPAPVVASMPAGAPAAGGRRAVGVAACMRPLLRLAHLTVFDPLGKL